MFEKIPPYLRKRLQSILDAPNQGIPLIDVEDGMATAVTHGSSYSYDATDLESVAIFYLEEYFGLYDNLVDEGRVEEE